MAKLSVEVDMMLKLAGNGNRSDIYTGFSKSTRLEQMLPVMLSQHTRGGSLQFVF